MSRSSFLKSDDWDLGFFNKYLNAMMLIMKHVAHFD